jgi:hypothetical protein
VIRAYVQALTGFGPRDHDSFERTLCLIFTVCSIPAQFLPVAIAGAGKWREAREVRRASAELAAWLDRGQPEVMIPEVQV